MKVNNRKRFFPDVTDEEWNDWKWQVRNRIETVDQLKKYIDLTEEEEAGIREALKTLRMAITPYYLSLIDTEDPECPIRKQAIRVRCSAATAHAAASPASAMQLPRWSVSTNVSNT